MRVFIIGILALMVWACSPAKESSKSIILDKDKKDSTEYEILVSDIHFEQWYLTNFNEVKDRTNEYYRYKDLVAVTNWNDYYRENKYSRVIDCRIDYWPNIDYGIEVNRKLYWYFKFVEEYYKISLF